jgi:molecular chaperone Hsp33
MVRDGLTANEMLQSVLGDLKFLVLEEREPKFQCTCSVERVRFMISALGRDEVEDMLKRDNGAEIICHYCNEKYQISGEELQTMLNES